MIALAVLSLEAYHTWRANRDLRIQISSLESRIRSLDSRQAVLRAQFQSKQTVELIKRSSYLNGLIEERAFPWSKMFADLEHVLPAGVRVISISPKKDENGRVKVVLEVGAENSEQKLKFLQAMVSSPVFSNVRIKAEAQQLKPTAGHTDKELVALEADYSII